MKVDLNAAHASWTQNPNPTTYEAFGQSLLDYLTIYVKRNLGFFNQQEATDNAVGNAIVEVLEQLPRYDKAKSAFQTWVTWILRNNFKDEVKSARHKFEEPIDPRSGMDYDFEERVARKITVKKALATLSAEDQEIVALKIDGFEEAEIAEQMGLNPKYVNNHWLRAKDKLSKLV